MSRVRSDQKYVNISRKEDFCTGPTKIIRIDGLPRLKPWDSITINHR